MEIAQLIGLFILIAISAFFSGSETAMMSLNRYRIRHLAKHHNKTAHMIQSLVERPDRLLGIILIGNTLANIVASAIATLLTAHLFGEWGVVASTIVLTLVILIFAEVLPKTLAAMQPERYAKFAAWPLVALLWLLFPVIVVINTVVYWLLRPLGIVVGKKTADALDTQEIRTVVKASASKLAQTRQHMLMGVLELDEATLADVLVPKHKIISLDISEPLSDIIKTIHSCPYSQLPVYTDKFDDLIGVLHLKHCIQLLGQGQLTKKNLRHLLVKPYFVPEYTSLQRQLIQFQHQGQKLAFAVDEYGDISGIVTVEDILEEIVGQLDKHLPSAISNIKKLSDNSYLVDGDISVRDLIRYLNMDLPTDGPKTLGGLVNEYLEVIPSEKSCLKIQGYAIEIIKVNDNALQKAKITIGDGQVNPQ